MPALREALDAVSEAAHDAAAEATEAAVEAAEARAEAAEEAADLLAEAGLRTELAGRVDALRAEHERCHADHETRLSSLQTSHEAHLSALDNLRQEVAALASKAPVVVPVSSTPAASVEQAEAEAEATPLGAVVIPAAAQAGDVAAVVPAARRKGRFL